MRVLVTGAAGFLGSHLTDRLLGEGHTVLGVDNLATGDRENIAHLANEPRFRFEQRDICEAFDPGPVDYVFNMASPASPPEYLRLAIETLRVGSVGVENSLQIAAKYHAGYLHASTSECYGDPLVHPQTEDYWGNVNPVGPRSVYDEAKRYAEALVMAYHRSRGVNTHLVRIFNTYGPRLHPSDGRVISNFMMQALRGQQQDAADEVGDITEAARLRAVAEKRKCVTTQGLHHQVGNDAPIVRMQARAVGVEDAHQMRVHAVIAVVGHCCRLGESLGLVIHRARADWVHIAPVALRLRMHRRVAVAL